MRKLRKHTQNRLLRHLGCFYTLPFSKAVRHKVQR